MFKRPLPWVFALLAGGGVLFSQSAGDDGVLRVTTRLIQIDVVVTNDDGPVGDLAVEDFTVLDEGVRRAIAVFNVTRSDRSAEAAVELPEGVVSNRFDEDGRTPEAATVLLVDRFNTLAQDQPFADQQARTFLEDAPDDAWIAVYELTDQGLTVLGDYTSLPEQIREALDGRQPQHSVALQYSLCALDDFQPDADLLSFYSGPLILDTPMRIDAEPDTDPLLQMPRDFCSDRPSVPMRQVANYYLELRADQTAAALEAIVRRLADLPGRKNLVWLASSFPFTFDPHRHRGFYNAVTFSTLEKSSSTDPASTCATAAATRLRPGAAPRRPAASRRRPDERLRRDRARAAGPRRTRRRRSGCLRSHGDCRRQ